MQHPCSHLGEGEGEGENAPKSHILLAYDGTCVHVSFRATIILLWQLQLSSLGLALNNCPMLGTDYILVA